MKESVLFVDDDPQLLDALRDSLRREPYEVVTAGSAAEGLAILESRPIDVVVSDERMPGMTGSAFLAEVRRKHARTIRIILTGQASLDGAIRAINDGEIYRFLVKPCAPLQVARTVRDALLLRGLAREGVPPALRDAADRRRRAPPDA
ncbi:MAG TPA: response regulator [Planctomycetota bacterium]|jgi:DNA-binding NtrC family response regulator|nr:response regulator [Planctomycetota bacterium]